MTAIFPKYETYPMTSTILRPTGSDVRAVSETHINLYTPKTPFASTVLHKYRITDPSSPNFAWHVVLDIEGSQIAGQYRAGQSIGVVPSGRFAESNLNPAHRSLDHKIRLHSIASPCWGDDWKGKTVSLCVKREMGEDEQTGELVFGEASNLVCDAKPGDTVYITGPSGKGFLLPDDPMQHNYVFVATGTGIAPFRGMLIELFDQGYQGIVWLLFGVPYSTDLMYDEEFRYFAEWHPNFHYITAVSREQKNRDDQRLYVQHQMDEHRDTLVALLEKPETMLYMCGLKGMEFGIYKWLYRVGSSLMTLPEEMTVEEIQGLSRQDAAWTKIERSRQKARLLKETY